MGKEIGVLIASTISHAGFFRRLQIENLPLMKPRQARVEHIFNVRLAHRAFQNTVTLTLKLFSSFCYCFLAIIDVLQS